MFELNEGWKFEPSPGPQITAYTTTYNCLNGKYPVEDSIRSFAWCDKIIVVDGGSTDGTRDLLENLVQKFPNLTIIDIPIDLSSPGKDGIQKAMALAMVDTPLAIQFDIDEICAGSVEKWRALAKEMPDSTNIISLPVLEPIGVKSKIRMNREHTPWKWRLYKVKPEITHGIPAQDRMEVDGVVYSRGGSDGCFPIHCVTNEMIASKPSKSAQELTKIKTSGDKGAYKQQILKLIQSEEPHIVHLGHVNLENKIRHYLQSWHTWWAQLYNKDVNDPKNNVYFPGVSINDVTDEMIKQKALKIVEECPHVDLE